MPLETDPDLDSLNPAWPINTDGVNEGDDHLRNLKAALQKSLAGNATRAALKLPNGTELLAASTSGVTSANTGPNQHVLILRNTVAGMAIGVGTDGSLRVFRTDESGAITANLARYDIAGGWVLEDADQDRFLLESDAAVVRSEAGRSVFLNLRSGADDVLRLFVNEETGYLRSLVSALWLQRDGNLPVLIGQNTGNIFCRPDGTPTLTIEPAGDVVAAQGLRVGDAPVTPTDVVRKAELDAQDSRVSTLEGRWSGDNLTAVAIAADSLTVAGSPAVTRATVATETIPGSVEIATAAEVKAGTASNAASPAALAGNTNAGGTQIGLAGNVQQLSGTEQPTGPGTHSVTFSRPFTSAPRVLISPYISGTASGSSNQPIVVGDSISNTGFDVYIAGDVATGWRNFTWQAIGAY